MVYTQRGRTSSKTAIWISHLSRRRNERALETRFVDAAPISRLPAALPRTPVPSFSATAPSNIQPLSRSTILEHLAFARERGL